MDPQKRRHIRRQLLGIAIDAGLILALLTILCLIFWSRP